MSERIRLEKVGQRVYVGGDSYGIRDQLKRLGCHWDAGRRQWWIGAAKAAELEALLADAEDGPAKPAAPEDPHQVRLVGKASYKGRTYYVRSISQDDTRCRLTTLDAKVDFWADLGPGPEQAKIVKTYAPRQVRRGYGRYTDTVYTTLGSIRDFIEREQRNREAGGAVCAECGTSGELVRDLEDGLLKHRHCCDIEPS